MSPWTRLDADDDTTVFAIEVDGTVVGSIQTAEEADPDYRHAGVDLFLARRRRTRGSAPTPSGRSPGTSSRSAATTD